MKKTTTYILIADGCHARILASSGPGGDLKLVGKPYTAPNEKTRDLGVDRPGRAFESADGSRHAMEPRVDWHREEKRRFATRLAKMLDRQAERKVFDRLVLVAPPETLGMLRAAMGPAARARVTAEIAKDLTQVAGHDLHPHLEKALYAGDG